MKKLLKIKIQKIGLTLIVLSISLFALSFPASAQSPSPRPTNPVSENLDISKQIDELKEKVASKVAELKLVEKKGMIGTVTDVRGNQITLEDLSGNTRFVDVDEFTEFTPLKANASFGISDISKGMKIGALGLYNKESRRILARFVEEMDLPHVVSGVVADIDEKEFNIVLATEEKKQKVSIETVTKTFLVDSEGELTKGGFSDLTLAQNVVITGFEDPKDPEVITAGRIIVFEGVPQNPRIEVNIEEALPSPSASITPSTGSGRKLTPIVR